MSSLLRSTAVLMLAVLFGNCHAGFPDKPINIIVPYAAGGPMDKLARQLAPQMSSLLGQPVIVQNQGGAGGNIGVAMAKRAAPDGYTLLLDHVHMATAPSLYRKLDFAPAIDFEPLGVVAESPLILISRTDVPNVFADLLRWMARQPQVTLANAGIGSASHLCGLLLQSSLKLRMTTVPYKGTGPAMIDLMSGQVDLMCDLTANALPQIQAGKVRPIAVTVREPMSGTPLEAVPSMEKLGIAQGPLTIWYGLYAPRGTPTPVIQQLSAALTTVTNSAAFRKQQMDSGLNPVNDWRLTPAGHRKYLHEEINRWAGPIKAAGEYAD
ncbi:tripartite-type tricarboxylate transporter receptor subunit TctC [Variovorax sp. SG517]|uniref:tripartite tricarboxylate transporter substrate-binding protein n=1 Tax=Variovorax sp. SG517 TaxID=2587117 RepID=UPI00159D24D1|nr:tripartite tricarboxylate transporter substrate-binding protein [Variovorax sp. SG517]NVM90605.1 tripartite-type tricarboxylate transporter receptor subunit TctC [Variovorax sp. SG517]